MRFHLYVIFFIVIGLGIGFAQTLDTPGTLPSTTPAIGATMPVPLVLKDKERIKDDQKYDLPHPPTKDVDQKPVHLYNDEDDPPTAEAIHNLVSDDVLPAILELDKTQKDHGKYQWSSANNWDYCHYRDGDRDWYGWKTGGTFHWILFRSGFFWWRDNYAERWLYFYKGYWWWQSAKPPLQTQAFMIDKHYHTVDANGVLGDDLWTTGVVQSITTPVVKPTANATPGHGHHGGHRGGGGGTGSGTLPPPPSMDGN